MKIYTKSGDKGTTSLIGGERVPKYDMRVEAYGTVDELSAFVALLTDKLSETTFPEVATSCVAEFVEELVAIESRLMSVAALLAVGEGAKSIEPISEEAIEALEHSIDRMQEQLKPITFFTIPGGHTLCSLCHVCRTVCRRAERAALRAAENYAIESSAMRYLNRLSDYLYTLGRTLTELLSVEERLWRP
ncbi:MAG: cob(I)yrinic acid a,c-diamide adenosyltransferase [Alistipes sp.]|nr:cob(I)yrinic acid a,c-diamide adenosyltransferase [Alistipes sp.]